MILFVIIFLLNQKQKLYKRHLHLHYLMTDVTDLNISCELSTQFRLMALVVTLSSPSENYLTKKFKKVWKDCTQDK